MKCVGGISSEKECVLACVWLCVRTYIHVHVHVHVCEWLCVPEEIQYSRKI